MADFFSQDELKNITLTQEHDIPNVAEFSRQNPNVTLGNFKSEEELYEKEETKIDISKLPTFENQVIKEKQEDDNGLHSQKFRTQKDREMEVKKMRGKLYISMFFAITLILTAFVVYNLVSTLLLTNKATNNSSKIKDLNELIEDVKDDNAQIAKIDLPTDLDI